MYATATGTSPSMFSARNMSSVYHQVGVQTGINGATPHQLVVMLFNGFLDSIGKARAAMAAGQIEAKCEAITKCVRIVDEGLKASLNLQEGGQLAHQLYDLYGYITKRLTQANLHNDPAALEECVRLLTPIREAWMAMAPTADNTPRQTLEVQA
ncbi:flagellar export chaperone FliS [Aquabacterium sp.]|uniref:flagellar export chaperone FliS n=1 Tax=Aquabacterium sp. TaxID=1872578 RepID=UPI002E360F78|nr:flagellar export chaperone FliS [Aquabacterium sp.]HEX5310324.1 flagellar export chaperone FliS [Aquabacterium sp.]